MTPKRVSIASLLTLVLAAAAAPVHAQGFIGAPAPTPPPRSVAKPAPKPAAPPPAATGAGGDAGKPQAASLVVEEAVADKSPPFPVGEERARIGAYVRNETRAIHDCYERALEKNPTLHGKLIGKFVIGSNGRVIGVMTEGIEQPEMIVCVQKVIRSWQFEKPASGGKLSVKFPWTLEPAAAR